MNYAVRDVEFRGNSWVAKVGTYESCFCDFNKTKITLKIFQNKRPSKEDFIKLYKRVKIN